MEEITNIKNLKLPKEKERDKVLNNEKKKK